MICIAPMLSYILDFGGNNIMDEFYTCVGCKTPLNAILIYCEDCIQRTFDPENFIEPEQFNQQINEIFSELTQLLNTNSDSDEI